MLTVSTPPSGMARRALLQRFQKTCFMASRSARARRLRTLKLAHDAQLAGGAGVVLEQQQRFFDQRNDVNIGEVVGLHARIIEEVGDDLIQALRFAADDLDEFLVVFIKRRETSQFFQRAGHGRQRLANFVGDGGGKAAESGHALGGDDFPFEAFQFGEILEVEDEAHILILRGAQRRNREAEKARERRRRSCIRFPCARRAGCPARRARRARSRGKCRRFFRRDASPSRSR